MAEAGVVAVVASQGDRLAAALVPRLRARNLSVVECEPQDLPEQPIVLDSERFELDGRPVGALVWRVPLGMPPEPPAVEPAFVHTETAAAWLAALSLPGIYAVNRYSASVWYSGGHWPAWQGWLRRRDIPVSKLRLGDPEGRDIRWPPFVSSGSRPTTAAHPVSSALLVAGELMAGAATRGIRTAAAALTAAGVALARLTVDESDRVLSVDATPDFRRGDEVTPVVDRLAETIDKRLRAR